MHFRKALSFAALLAVLVVTANAQTGAVDPTGRPKFKQGAPARYVVWHDSDGWHVRTTTNKDIKFAGSIEIVGGKMVSLQPLTVEGKAGAKKKPNPKSADYGSWNPELTRFDFSFGTRTDGLDGFDMKVSDKATALKFTLKTGGDLLPAAIFIGGKNAHPKEATFELPAHPK